MLYFNRPEPVTVVRGRNSLTPNAGLQAALENRRRRLEDLRIDLYDLERAGGPTPLSAEQLLLLEDEGYVFNFVTGYVEKMGG